MLVIFTLGTAIVVGLIASLATNNWLFLVLAIAAHLLVSGFVLAATFKRAADQSDKPDPVTEAHIEAGDIDPSAARGGLTDSGRRDDREVVI